MDMKNLAIEYRKSGEAIRCRVNELRRILLYNDIQESERIILERRFRILSSMARETIEISNYLDAYYPNRRAAND